MCDITVLHMLIYAGHLITLLRE